MIAVTNYNLPLFLATIGTPHSKPWAHVFHGKKDGGEIMVRLDSIPNVTDRWLFTVQAGRDPATVREIASAAAEAEVRSLFDGPHPTPSVGPKREISQIETSTEPVRTRVVAGEQFSLF